MEGGPGTRLGGRLLGDFSEFHDPVTWHYVPCAFKWKPADSELNPGWGEIILVDLGE